MGIAARTQGKALPTAVFPARHYASSPSLSSPGSPWYRTGAALFLPAERSWAGAHHVLCVTGVLCHCPQPAAGGFFGAPDHAGWFLGGVSAWLSSDGLRTNSNVALSLGQCSARRRSSGALVVESGRGRFFRHRPRSRRSGGRASDG